MRDRLKSLDRYSEPFGEFPSAGDHFHADVDRQGRLLPHHFRRRVAEHPFCATIEDRDDAGRVRCNDGHFGRRPQDVRHELI
jgi:hypothetical protein